MPIKGTEGCRGDIGLLRKWRAIERIEDTRGGHETVTERRMTEVRKAEGRMTNIE
jgi:hypothetical protein